MQPIVCWGFAPNPTGGSLGRRGEEGKEGEGREGFRGTKGSEKGGGREGKRGKRKRGSSARPVFRCFCRQGTIIAYIDYNHTFQHLNRHQRQINTNMSIGHSVDILTEK